MKQSIAIPTCSSSFQQFFSHRLFTHFIDSDMGPFTVAPSRPLPELLSMSKFERSHIMAELSYIAYESIPSAKAKARELGFKSVQFYEHGNAQCYRFVSDHDIVIAARGTETTETEDILSDLKIHRVPPCKDLNVPGLVHRGFRGEAFELWHAARDNILLETASSHKLWFTGHSLGAAIATLLSTYSQHDKATLDPTGLVTFGSPRVGNREFACNADKVVPDNLRWVNNDDVVTKVPFNMFGLYTHCGSQMYLKEDGTCLSDVAWSTVFADRLWGRLSNMVSRQLQFSDGKDHGMGSYLAKIKKLADEERSSKSKM